ncbi:MAG: BrnA antitoxin family protein [Elusimicrobia bacterium]|nr:BrnA antitoxin family protein [Elusimicrobiota bacterium]MBU2615058.1 BrnA antitoxin family protein [Elusimicrobiota bacterium]
MKKLKNIPKFRNESEETEFWAKHDSTEYVDWSKAKKVILPNLKPSSKSIPIRFPVPLLERIKVLANKNNIPYQSLIKTYLADRIEKEFHKV